MGFLEGRKWGGTLESSRHSLGLGQCISPTPYSHGHVGSDLILSPDHLDSGTPPQWAGVPAARPLEEVGVISGPVPREQLTKML